MSHSEKLRTLATCTWGQDNDMQLDHISDDRGGIKMEMQMYSSDSVAADAAEGGITWIAAGDASWVW